MIDATTVQGTRLAGNTGDVLTKTENGVAWLPPQAAHGTGSTVDPSNYYTKQQTNNLLAAKANNTALSALESEVASALGNMASKSEVTALAADVDAIGAGLDDKQAELPEGEAGKYLKKTADGVAWDTPASVGQELPSGKPGQFLSLSDNGLVWADISFSGTGVALPPGEPGKYLKSTEDGPVWSDVSFSGTGAADLPAGDPGKYLKMTEDGPAWADISFSGTGAAELPDDGMPGQYLRLTAEGPVWDDISYSGTPALPDDGSVGQYLALGATGPEWRNLPVAVTVSGDIGIVESIAQLGEMWEANESIRGTTGYYLCNGSNVQPSGDELTAGHLYRVYFMEDESDSVDPFGGPWTSSNGHWQSVAIGYLSHAGDTVADGWYNYDAGQPSERRDGLFKVVTVPAYNEKYVVEADVADLWSGATTADDAGGADRAGFGAPLRDYQVLNGFAYSVWVPSQSYLDGMIVGVVLEETDQGGISMIPVKALDLTMSGDLYMRGTMFVQARIIEELTTRVNALENFHFGTLTVNATGDAPEGAGWSVDGGTTWVNIGTGNKLQTGAYTVTFAPVAGYDTPAAQSVTVTAGGSTPLTVEYLPEAPAPAAAYSVQSAIPSIAGTFTLEENITTMYDGAQYPVYKNGSMYLAMRSNGRPAINSSADGASTHGWVKSGYTAGAAMSAESLSGEWANGPDASEDVLTFTAVP